MKIFPRQKIYNFSPKAIFKTQKVNTKEEIKTLNRNFKDQYIIPTFNARAGLYFALKKVITSKKKKIIICPFTIIDIINIILYSGGVPVFLDSKKNTPHISASEISSAIDDEVAACIVTHYHTNNPEIDIISKICDARKVILIEDCALVAGCNYENGSFVGSHGLYSFFSFGLLKTISTVSCGILKIKNYKEFQNFNQNMKKSKIYDYFDLIFKSFKFLTLMNFFIFKIFTFKIIKLGEKYDISFLRNLTKNDPYPILKKKIPSNYLKKPKGILLHEINRQFFYTNKIILKRRENYKFYEQLLEKSPHKERINFEKSSSSDSCINFPILIKNRKKIIRNCILNNLDVSQYYYRNCADLKIFERFKKKNLLNLTNYVSELVLLPTYPEITKDYQLRLIRAIEKILINEENE